MFKFITNWLIDRIPGRREPDFIVGGKEDPYLLRWWIIPRNRYFNIYLHYFLRDDEDRALHDHPWHWCSILLRGAYVEHTIAAGGIHKRQVRQAPSIKFSRASRAHRIELLRGDQYIDIDGEVRDSHSFGEHAAVLRAERMPCWTLFITGPVFRRWGFHCPKGWVDFKEFTRPDDIGQTGKGCD